ncbi:cation diffusion facilitator family transporter [Levilactobacillus brevis]|uniref:cation diffusion facilitator family transporter n=1 Tax=Levilactobacillus brevis TaxID=1580 RepID=UPI00063AEF3B|nr:cation diffusion facilitator family transporter [Levilactobacillus brevis]KLE30882.1 cobalt transporter [Levilactobacillus brevis]MBX6948024.1 cation diffusion facilitator family transporter [Levilactobacillus brevis]MCT3568928.1 cation transporter [Levilactobacillus brevis]MCT3577824.1 cation transporter [Levilactobacillus brevis]PTV21691.1 cation transporter [Levilactobacillus brevis]
MEKSLTGGRFLLVTILNVVITIFELLGGLLSGSLSLLSDAFHNLGDALSVVMSYVAHRVGGRQQTRQNTFGYRRAEILAALLNAAVLILVSLLLAVEAVRRLLHPEPVKGDIMLLVAVVSFLANLFSTVLLNHGAQHNLNIRATYLHLLSDALASVGVIIGAVLITIWQISWVDPLITVLVALYIIYESWPIIKQTFDILMEGSPDLDYEAIAQDICALPEVDGVHHLHAWLIDENNIVFSVHVNMENLPLSKIEPIYRQIEALLCRKYGVSHVTIQAECRRGKDESLFYDQNDWRHE